MRQPTTLAEFEDVLAEGKREGKTVVVDFTATWCGPCQRIAPTYAALEQEFRHVIFIKVDVDENQETARHCSVKAMPTFKVFREGKEAETMQGANPDGLKEMVQRHMGEKWATLGSGQTLGGGEPSAPPDAASEREKRLAALATRGL